PPVALSGRRSFSSAWWRRASAPRGSAGLQPCRKDLLMRLVVTALMLGSLLAIGTLTVDLHGQDGRIEAWAPMPEKPNPFTPPHKALTKLSDVMAKHKGQQSWT